jgi:AcrR family transcriptional regulator
MKPAIRERRRESILQAATELVMTKGLAVTMNDVAQASGVGRSTLFRYFSSKADLLRAVLERGYEPLDRGGYQQLIESSDDLLHGLRGVFTLAHSHPGRIALWELVRDSSPPLEYQPAITARHRARRHYVPIVTNAIWREAGGTSTAPYWLVQLFGLLESLFAYYAWNLDAGLEEPEIADVAARAMNAAVRGALCEQSR